MKKNSGYYFINRPKSDTICAKSVFRMLGAKYINVFNDYKNQNNYEGKSNISVVKDFILDKNRCDGIANWNACKDCESKLKKISQKISNCEESNRQKLWEKRRKYNHTPLTVYNIKSGLSKFRDLIDVNKIRNKKTYKMISKSLKHDLNRKSERSFIEPVEEEDHKFNIEYLKTVLLYTGKSERRVVPILRELFEETVNHGFFLNFNETDFNLYIKYKWEEYYDKIRNSKIGLWNQGSILLNDFNDYVKKTFEKPSEEKKEETEEEFVIPDNFSDVYFDPETIWPYKKKESYQGLFG